MILTFPDDSSSDKIRYKFLLMLDEASLDLRHSMKMQDKSEEA
jgi:hypothetical protein